jgi:hypothetical protein
MTKNNLNVFPLIKKFNMSEDVRTNPDKVPENEIQELALHYTDQLAQHFINHGFSDSGFFYQDMDFLNDLVESILLRAMGKHHDMQDLVDNVMQDFGSDDITEDVEIESET